MTIIKVKCPYCQTECTIMIEVDSAGTYDCINPNCQKEFAVETKARVIATECDPCTQF